jgi:hypothetical protein
MRTKTVTLYKFAELSETAKQKAYDNWLAGDRNNPWANENINTLFAFKKIFPITLGHNDLTQFSFAGDDEIEQLRGQRLANYIWNNYKSQIYKGRYYSTSMKKIKVDKEHPAGLTYTKRYSRIQLDNCCVLTGYCMDDEILNPIYTFLNKPDENITFGELMQKCIDNFKDAVEKDDEYSYSMEFFMDEAEANDYEFTENGELA